jgi:hypothetical protein
VNGIHRDLLDFLNPIVATGMSCEKTPFARSRRLLEPGQCIRHDRFSIKAGSTKNGDNVRIGFVLGLRPCGLATSKSPATGTIAPATGLI